MLDIKIICILDNMPCLYGRRLECSLYTVCPFQKIQKNPKIFMKGGEDNGTIINYWNSNSCERKAY